MVLARLFVIFVYLVGLLIFKKLIYYFIVTPNGSQFSSFWNNNETVQDVYDYIIVGCGSAGAILANRLAEDRSASVLVLEAGVNTGSFLDIPSVGLLLQQTGLDWQYETVSQKFSCFALNNNSSRWPMGKVVGGTSMLNNMIYVRGHRKDFEEWFDGKENFHYSDVEHYFKKMENRNIQDNLKESVFINELSFASSIQNVIMRAAKSVGYIINDDTTNCNLGFGKPKATLKNGERWTSANHLKHKSKPNIKLKTRATVEKVILKQNFEVQGVVYSSFQKKHLVNARRAVILSSGVIGTPKILMLSGIGPKSHLQEMDIEPKVDLPVGNNLQDHITTGFDLVLLNQTLDIGIEEMLSPYTIFDYFWHGKGPWTTTGCEVIAFIDTKEPQTRKKYGFDEKPNLQFMVMPLGVTEDMGYHLRNLIGISDFTWKHYFEKLNNTKAITILPILLHPKSKGIVRLRDRDPSSQPLIDPKYLSSREDIDVLIGGINLVKDLIKTDDMQKLGARLNDIVFPGCESYKFNTNSYWECYIKHLTITSYHPVGTCKMGLETDSSTVVNYNFQVKGTNKLYVVDGSVVPTLTSGNIVGAIYMLAEMAADAIKENYYLSSKKCNAKDIFLNEMIC